VNDQADGKPMVRVLGPIDVRTNGHVATVGGRARRALLGTLAIRAGHAVPVSDLRTTLWGDEPPTSADNVVQSYVSRLRHALGDAAVVSSDHSYTLDLRHVDIDAARFQEMAQRAHETEDPAERLTICRKALGLWRGRPFGELADVEAFQFETYRLDSLRDALMELALETELMLGRHELVVGELHNAVREQPYNERMWFLLIQALALCDRRVEALRACVEVRRTLGEVGLGIDEQLNCLEHLILDGTRLTVEQTNDPCAAVES
jgi:DNA-binding SARP family transcriptional activator